MTVNDAPPSDAGGGSYGLKELLGSVKAVASKPVFWVSIVGACFAVSLALVLVELRSSRRQLRERASDRAASCSRAKSTAINSASLLVKAASSDEPGLAAIHAGQTIAVFMFACQANRHDYDESNLTLVFSHLIAILAQSRQFDALDQFLVQLQQTPLDHWKDLELPDAAARAAESGGP